MNFNFINIKTNLMCVSDSRIVNFDIINIYFRENGR